MGTNNVGSGTLKTMARAGRNLTLISGQSYIIPNGTFYVQPGPYTFLQWYDPVSQQWRNFAAPFNGSVYVIESDGANYRLFNATGTVVGAVITNGGTANTAKNGVWAPGTDSSVGVTCTTTAGGGAPAGTAKFTCIVGGAVSTTVTVTAGGANYTKPPVLVFSNPAPGGLPATGYAVLTAGAISSVTVTNQGAGYPKGVVPTITVINDPTDTTGAGAVLTAALDSTQDGKLIAVTMADFGSGYAAVPTLTLAGLTSAAATAINCFTIVTAPTLSSATHLGNGHQLIYPGQLTGGSNTTTNPLYTTGLFQVRDGRGAYNTSATGASQVIVDGGLSQVDVANLPVITLSPDGTTPGAATYASGASGGKADTSIVIPA